MTARRSNPRSDWNGQAQIVRPVIRRVAELVRIKPLREAHTGLVFQEPQLLMTATLVLTDFLRARRI